MHIKNSPIIPIKEGCAGFSLDTNKIELHSADKKSILLPYLGVLPEKLQNNDGAFVSFVIRVGLNINVHLIIRDGKKDTRFLLEATSQEIHDLLFSFFFVDKGGNKFETAWGCGLGKYWLGHFQSAFANWERIVLESYGVCDVLTQLSPDNLQLAIKHIDFLKESA